MRTEVQMGYGWGRGVGGASEKKQGMGWGVTVGTARKEDGKYATR